ncbi:cytochrome C [Fertoebacter nigrum]|uniref:Cytochrome C n=1 Tax=Fertoeibacter niger TaxID=2656921 RepID=A0A8X8H126_9RHOB|nr:cytochrome C [Fertoeibacter niger]NUB43598.1 cytochrome C [Fertoeibacter niger]
MKIYLSILAATAFAAAPALAEGDAAAGEKAFSQCQTCHVVVNDAGETLAGRNAKTGPNLFGVIGRQAGSLEGFKGYGDSLVEAGAAGLVWNEEQFVAYVQDPTAYLKEVTGDSKARGKMTYKVRKAEDAANLYAFLSTFSAAPAEGAAAEGEAPAATN